MTVHPAGTTRRNPTVCACLTALTALACSALLAACSAGGAPAGGASASAAASASPAPVPSPVVTSGEPPAAAVDVVRTFWSQIGRGDIQGARDSSIAPGSPLLDWTGDDIAAAKLERVLPNNTVGALRGATMTFGVDVWIKPSGVTPWGDTGSHTLFASVVRMSDGSWRMWDVNTSP